MLRMTTVMRALMTATLPLLCAVVSSRANELRGIAPVRVPFAAVGNLVIVDVRLNGSRPLSFVLDTGAARMVVETKVSRELQLGEGDTIGGAGAGRIPVRRIKGVDVEVGGVPSKDHEFVATDLSGIGSLIGHGVDGILGYEFLSRFIVTVDYSNSRLELRDARSAEPIPDGEELPIRLHKGWPFVRGTLKVTGADDVTDEFLIDSGSDDAVNHPLAAQATDRRPTRTGNGLGSPVDGFIATARSLELGSHTMRDLPIASGGGSEQTSRLIGGGVLSRFTVTFDYPHSRIFLAPRQPR